jgi:hypothetical protein
MLGTSPSPRQAQSHDDQSGDDIIPSCTSGSIREQPRGCNQPKPKYNVYEAQRSCNLRHRTDRNRNYKRPDKMIAIGHDSSGVEN